jgi:hypothetical protein
MSLRIFSALGLLIAVAACEDSAISPPPPGDTVDCAIGAGAELSPVCTLEQVAGTNEIVIHHPDGGFKRLIRDTATGDLAPLDGADPLVIEQGSGVQFAVGADRYSIPPELLTPAAQ